MARLAAVGVAGALLASTLFVGCSSCGPRQPGAPPAGVAPSRPNLLLITIDTTRADRIGAYGDASAATPGLDSIARDGVLCTRAIAVAPLTLPSHVSILTGLYPPRHGVRDNSDFRLPDSELTLAEHLKAQGYATGGVVAALVLSKSLGIAQGFDTWDEPASPKISAPQGAAVRFAEIVERRATEVTDSAIRVADGFADRPFFLWTHYYDPHYDYRAPEPFASRFPRAPYSAEIAYMDSEIGRLLDHLRAKGTLDRTLVIVIADHGESLGEHGEDTHGLFVYDSTVHVPLLARLPGTIPPGRRHDDLVSGVDVAATALELMGLPPMPGGHGKSAAASFRGGTSPEREPVYSEAIYPERIYGWAPLFALRSAGRKFIQAPESELYDLAADSGEKTNLAATRGDEARDWLRKLRAAVEGFGKPDPSAESAMTAEQRANLESLGYLSATPGAAGRRERPDPKRFADVHNTVLRAHNLVATGDYAGVETLLQQALKRDPGNPAANALLGTIRFSGGRQGEGLEALQAAAKAAPTVYETQWNLANALHLAHRWDEAGAAYRAASALQPASPHPHHGLANLLAATGRPQEAVGEYRRAIELGLNTPPVVAALGAALADSGNTAEAERMLRAAAERDSSLAPAWNKLGVLAEKAGKKEEALGHYNRALSARPEFADALFNRGKMRLLAGNLDAARADATALVKAHPDYGPGLLLRANIMIKDGDKTGARDLLGRLVSMRGADPRSVEGGRQLLRQLGG